MTLPSTVGSAASRLARGGAGAPPVRVMIVDDSAVVRGAVGRLLDADDDCTVVTTAATGRQALAALKQHAIDVVILDIDMPEMDGLSALPLIRLWHPHTRVLMLSVRGAAGADVTVRALALGAADFVCKSGMRAAGTTGGSRVSVVEAYADELRGKVRTLGRAAQRALQPVPCAPRPSAPPAAASGGSHAPAGTPASPPPPTGGGSALGQRWLPRRSPTAAATVLAIASSTGGPQALATFLGALPASLSVPILITQHMPPEFTRLLAERLATSGGRPCAEAREGETPRPGHIYVAPGDHHLLVHRDGRDVRMHLSKEPPVNHCRPAADPMLRSIAAVYGAGVVAVVLTGMGADGRDGAAEVVRRGGMVLAQDEATSVVWGMPGAVVNAGLATAVVPIGRMAAEVTRRAASRDPAASDDGATMVGR